MIIKPQAGYQEKSLSSSADIVIGGAAAGVGKTFSLLLEPLRHLLNNEGFGGVVFRRTSPQIKAEGALWDTSLKLYSLVGASPRQSTNEWVFPVGSKIKFSHMEYEKNKLDWQGSQIPFIGFDELTHFTETMFFYLLSRNRSTCGVKPYVRCTCNPDPESWVARLIEWWIDQDTGFPVPERDGVVRYFIKDGSNYIWGDTEEEVYERGKYLIDEAIEKSKKGEFQLTSNDFIKSLTFISGSIYENTELLKTNPSYLANLMAQSEAEKASLLEGNWKVRLSDLDIYDYNKFLNIFTNDYVKHGERYMTSDIAGRGSDLFTLWAWSGSRVIGFDYMEKSDGPEVISKLKEFANKHEIPYSNISFDADGIGGLVDGFLETSRPFINNSKALQVDGITEEYKNLKTQCYYRSGDAVGRGEYYIPPEIANMMVGDKTLKQKMISERKAIKRDKADMDGKLCIIDKKDMKAILGNSPDILDGFSQKPVFDLINPHKAILKKPIYIEEFPKVDTLMHCCALFNENKKSSLLKVGVKGNDLYIDELFCDYTSNHSSMFKEDIDSILVGYEIANGYISALRNKEIVAWNNVMTDREKIPSANKLNEYNIFITEDSINLIDNFKKFSYDVETNGLLKNTPKTTDDETILPLLALFKAKGKLW